MPIISLDFQIGNVVAIHQDSPSAVLTFWYASPWEIDYSRSDDMSMSFPRLGYKILSSFFWIT